MCRGTLAARGCAVPPRLPASAPKQILPTSSPSASPPPTRSVLEATEELRAALVAGLDTLVAISYVDDDEARGCLRGVLRGVA